MEHRYYEPESDPEDCAEYPNYSVMKANFMNMACFKINKALYATSNENHIVQDYFDRNNLVQSVSLNPKSQKLFGKFFNLEKSLDKYYQTARTQHHYIDDMGYFPMGSLIKESIESGFRTNYFKENMQNCLEVFYSQTFGGTFLVSYDREQELLVFYSVNIQTGDRGHSFQLEVTQTLGHQEVNYLMGLTCVQSNKKTFLVFKYHNYYTVNEIIEEEDKRGEFDLLASDVQNFSDHFIKSLKINKQTGTIAALLVSANFLSYKLVAKTLNGDTIIEKDLDFHPINFDIYGSQDEILINSNSTVFFFNSRTKELLVLYDLKSDQGYLASNIVYSAFNFQNYKFFGYVTSTQIVFGDYRFPKNGILAFSHGQVVPPDQMLVSKNLQQDMFVQRVLAGEDCENILCDIDKFSHDYSKLVLLYSLRKQGSILTFPYFDYQEKQDIKNPFVYKLIKEINTTIHKSNKFMDLFDREVGLSRLYSSNLRYNDIQLTGIQSFVDGNYHFVVSIENNSLLNLQILSNNKNSEFLLCSFGNSRSKLPIDYAIENFSDNEWAHSSRKARVLVEIDTHQNHFVKEHQKSNLEISLKSNVFAKPNHSDGMAGFETLVTSSTINRLKDIW
jgi:hypothetical protein